MKNKKPVHHGQFVVLHVNFHETIHSRQYKSFNHIDQNKHDDIPTNTNYFQNKKVQTILNHNKTLSKYNTLQFYD